MDGPEPWQQQTETLGAFIRAQRRLADLSLREMATLTDVSNAYLSQVERGLHQPSVRVLSSIARALGVSPESMLAAAGLGEPDPQTDATAPHTCSTEEAIRHDPGLSDAQREALLGVYHSFRAAD